MGSKRGSGKSVNMNVSSQDGLGKNFLVRNAARAGMVRTQTDSRRSCISRDNRNGRAVGRVTAMARVMAVVGADAFAPFLRP